MAGKPESSVKVWHILVPAATTLMVALIGLFSAVYQTEKPIQATAAAAARTLTAAVTVQPSRAAASTPQPGKTVQATLPANSIQIQNKLVLPITISIDSVDKGQLEDGGVKIYLLDHFPVSVKWSLVKQTTEKGTPLGHEMGGTFSDIAAGDDLIVEANVDGQPYFSPFISNHTQTDCEVTINKGFQSEFITHAVSAAQTDNIGFGYYQLYSNSNVVLDCAGETYWWGTLPNETNPKSFYDDVDKDSGLVDFILK